MAKLYIANVTQQNQIVYYRLDLLSDGARDGRLVIPPKMTPPIPPGRQMPIGGDLHPDQIGSITDQLRPYGLFAQVDMNRLPRGKKVSYIFNIDREVSAEAIRAAHAHNTGVLVEDGKARRKRSAVAASDTVARTVAESSPVNAPMTGFDISVEQVEDDPAGGSRLEEGLRVAVGADAAPEAPRGGRGSRGARGSRAQSPA